MRVVLVHDYMVVDLLSVWRVVKERLPEVKLLIKA